MVVFYVISNFDKKTTSEFTLNATKFTFVFYYFVTTYDMIYKVPFGAEGFLTVNANSVIILVEKMVFIVLVHGVNGTPFIFTM